MLNWMGLISIIKVLLLVLHRITQKLHHAPETIFQTLPELCLAGAVTTPLGILSQCPATLWRKNFFLISSLTLL